ncbi:MAG TPA: GntR family transcriptional regulator [Acidimicrobiales bacterium]|nr:GntR family transcriptional regulator [Acidimicrobiales bacterium]
MYEKPVLLRDVTAGKRRGNVAYTAVRQMIVARTWPPGEALTETELARRLGVSRTPVREALQRLANEGYIAPAGGRGYLVIELSEQDVINVYRVRAVLEGLAAHDAATAITRAQLGGLEDLYEAMEDARGRMDDQALAKLNSQFHHAVAGASGNTYLESTLNGMYDVFERFRPVALVQPGRRGRAAQEHGELIEALRARDADAARSVAERHVQRALATRQTAARYAAREAEREAAERETSEGAGTTGGEA